VDPTDDLSNEISFHRYAQQPISVEVIVPGVELLCLLDQFLIGRRKAFALNLLQQPNRRRLGWQFPALA